MTRFSAGQQKPFVIAAILLAILAGCATWKYPALSEMPVPANVPPAKACADCHEEHFASWNKTVHADTLRMAKIPIQQFRGCGACHANLDAHAQDPTNVLPPSISKLGKVEQNQVCGKCHYNKEMLKSYAINPHNRHGLFMSVGFEGFKDTLICLECHSGHSTKSDMLQRIQAHVCFKCHKEAIVTMGAYQPLNYLAMGKLCTLCHAVHGAAAPHQAARLAVGAVATCLICHPTGDVSRLGFSKGGEGGGD